METKTTDKTKPDMKYNLTLNSLNIELQSLRELVEAHSHALSELQEQVSRKRRAPNTNGKIQIRDKQTGKVYPSKNNCYQTLLRAGELKDLVAKGVFGDVPEKNNFGWYQLVRELPGRFEEVKPQASSEEKPGEDDEAKSISSVHKKQ